MNPHAFEDAIETTLTPLGLISYFKHDKFLGGSLREYGEWARKELDFLGSLIEVGSVVVDVGGFIGTHTLAFSRFVGDNGLVYSFEPHPTYFMALQRNIESNGLINVRAFNQGLSFESALLEVENLDLERTNSLGSVQLADVVVAKEKLSVTVDTLDSMKINRCRLIKIDVEGMEESVLKGAKETLLRCRPFVFAECNSANAGWPVVELLRSLDYKIFLHSELAFNPQNFLMSSVNMFDQARELAIIGVPSELETTFRVRVTSGVEVIPIYTLDDLVMGLLKKPQYKAEVLAHATGVKIWGENFWANEGELAQVRTHASNIENLLSAQQRSEESLRVLLGEKDVQLTQLREFADARRDLIAELSQNMSSLSDVNGSLDQRLANIDSQLTHAVSNVARLELELSQQNAARAEHSLAEELRIVKLADQSRTIANLHSQIEAIRGSRSWRFMAPLRSAANVLRRLSQKLRRLVVEVYRRLPIAQSQKQNLKGAVFSVFGFAFGGLGAYQRWKSYRDIETTWQDARGTSTPATTTETQLIVAAPPRKANGLWEWADYGLVKARIAQVLSAAAEKVDIKPVKMIDLRDEDLILAAKRVALPAYPSTPKVSIIIPIFNNLKCTIECLLSLSQHAQKNVSWEIIVTDDASTDASGRVLPLIDNLRYFRNDENLGFLKNCNGALRFVKGEYVLFLNNDVQLTPSWLESLLATFDQFSDVGAVGPKFVFPSGHLQEAGGALREDGGADMLGLNQDPNSPSHNYPRKVDYVSGACLLIRTELLKKVGGFSQEFAPSYCEDSDMCLKVQEAGFHVYCNPLSIVVHHLSKTMNGVDQSFKLRCVSKNLVTLQNKWSSRLELANLTKVIAFYLPQFHPVPENSQWWGHGFTEWTNVSKARPNFLGHYQPRVPGDLGYYDLRLTEVMQQQADLARRYGVEGFCFYYYWFGGKRLLEQPIEQLLASKTPDFPFCLCWANENWTRRWDGQDQEVLMAQSHSPEDDEAVIMDLIRYFRDVRYIRIDGRPLILVYRVSLFPNFLETTNRWRKVCRDQGIGEIYIAMVESFELVFQNSPPSKYGCDAAVEFPPQGLAEATSPSGEIVNSEFVGTTADYRDLAVRYATREAPGYTRFRGVIPGWDNTARRQDNSFCFENAFPGTFQAWLESSLDRTRKENFGDERIVFVNAWNEWAEGAYLEPDARFGHSFLEAIANAKDAQRLLQKPTPQTTVGVLDRSVGLVGHPYAPIGMGEHVRCTFRALNSVAIKPSVTDIYKLVPPDAAFLEEFGGSIVEEPSQINIFLINGNEVEQAMPHLSFHREWAGYKIIYPAWELARYPQEWAAQLDRFDEIWAPSKFIQSALQAVCKKPVFHMPLATDVVLTSFLTRRYFGISESEYVFLFFFDVRSFRNRKNPEAVVEAFRKLIKLRPYSKARLILKINGSEIEPVITQKLREDLRDISHHVTFIERVMSDNEVKNLVRCCDCFVSLHRSEGYGRGLSEAMNLGKPVIGTGYSGNMDFMNPDVALCVGYRLIPLCDGDYPHFENQVWADADIEEAILHMIALIDNPELGRQIGRRAKAHMMRHFSYRTIGMKYRTRLEAISEMLSA
jgi:O-antigen biosynthesis protein